MKLIVVGGSAGGLEALQRLVAALPDDFAAPLIVVLHTKDGRSRFLDVALRSHTTLSVTYAKEGDSLRAGGVYIAPHGSHLVVRDSGLLGLDIGPKIRDFRPAVDRLFASAAEVFGNRVIGVVLSGGDGDGTDGLIAIKRRGGTCVVQSPSDSVAPRMPSEALLHDSPDYVALVDELGALVAKLALKEPRG